MAQTSVGKRKQETEENRKQAASFLIASVGGSLISVTAHFHMWKKRLLFCSMLTVLAKCLVIQRHQKVAVLRWMASPRLGVIIIKI